MEKRELTELERYELLDASLKATFGELVGLIGVLSLSLGYMGPMFKSLAVEGMAFKFNMESVMHQCQTRLDCLRSGPQLAVKPEQYKE